MNASTDVSHIAPQRVIRKKDLPDFCGLQRTVIEAMIARNEFPKPIKLNDSGRAIAWIASEVAEWQRQRISKRDAEAALHSVAAK